VTWRNALTEAQIRATLERHGFNPDTPIRGIRYGDIVTIAVRRAVLIVPTEVLQMPRETEGPESRTLFDHGG